MENNNPGCSAQIKYKVDLNEPIDESKLEQYHLNDPRLDYHFYLPANIWPEEATEMDRPDYLHVRWTKWKYQGVDNESNKNLLDSLVKTYSINHPEVEDPLKDDDFWLINTDALINNSLKNRDYKYELDHPNEDIFNTLCNYDVFMQVTLGGYTCHPVFAYNMRSRDEYMVYITWDDYAKKRIDAIWDKWQENKKDYNPNWHITEDGHECWPGLVGVDEHLADWQKIGAKEWHWEQCKMIQEGHYTYEVKLCDRDKQSCFRWVDHNDKSNGPKGKLHKSIW